MERACIDSTDAGADLLMVRLLIPLLLIGCSQPSTSLPYPLVISEEGLGAIHPDTPMEEIPSLMIGFKAEKLTPVSSSATEILYQIKRGGTPIAHIVSDPSGKRVASIHVLSPAIKDPYDQSIGQPLKAPSFVCQNGRCTDPSKPQLIYNIDPKTRSILEITFQKL